MKSPQVDLESLGELEETSGFDWIRFIDREGSDYTSNGKFAEVSDREYYQEGIAGKSGICIVMKSRVNQKRLVGFYAPVYYQGEVCGVMVGFLQESTVSQILATELYGSNVGTMIVDISGTVLGKDGKKETADIEMIDDILPLLDENEQQSVKNALKNKDKTQYDYTDEMGSSVGYLVPIKGTDWMLMQSFPTDVVQKFAKKVTNDERLAMSAFGLVLAIFVFRFVYLIKRKKRLDREKSNRDKVTSLLQNVSDDYICLIDVNLETEIEEQFPMHGGRDLGDWAKGNYDYTHCIETYANTYVCEKDRDTFLCATRLELLKKLLQKQKDFFIEYDALIDGDVRRLQGKFAIYHEEEQEDHMLVGIRDITEMEKEKIARDTQMNLIVSAASSVYPFILQENLTQNIAHTVYNAGIVNFGKMEDITFDQMMEQLQEAITNKEDYDRLVSEMSR